MTIVQPKQSADPSKPPRRGNTPTKDILVGVLLIGLAILCWFFVMSSHRLPVRLAASAAILTLAGPFLIIRGLVNHARDKSG